MTDSTDRLLPQDQATERSLLGAIMLEAYNADVVRPILKDGGAEFAHEKNQILYDVLQALVQSGRPLDANLMREELERRGHDKLANNEFLATFLGAVPTASNSKHYARTVHELYIRRRAIDMMGRVINRAFDTRYDLKEVLATCEANMLTLMESAAGSGVIHIAEAIQEFMETVTSQMGTGFPTGFYSLDGVIGGFRNSELIVLGARPGTGKTAFALGILEQLCVQQKKPCLLFTFEMSAKQLAARMVVSRTHIPMKALRADDLSEIQRGNLEREIGTLKATKLYVDTSNGLSVGEVAARARVAKRRFGVEFIAIDHLHHGMRPNRNYESDELRLRDIVHSLKALAKELDVPVLLLAQLSRKGANTRPILEHLRGSGAIEEMADIAMFLWRPEMLEYGSQGNGGVQPEEESAKLIVSKHRDGPCGEVDLTWCGRTVSFSDGRPLPQKEPEQQEVPETLPF